MFANERNMESFPAMKQYFKRQNERQHVDTNSNDLDITNAGVERQRNNSRRADSNSNVLEGNTARVDRLRSNSRRADSRSNVLDSANASVERIRNNSPRADSNSNVLDSTNTAAERLRHNSSRADSIANVPNNTNVGVGRLRSTSNSSEAFSGRSTSSGRKQFCDDMNIIVGAVRHPRYAMVGARARTFESWPKENVCVQKLNEAGFVYTLKDDIVECFQCGGVLRDWPDFADPWEQHALAFPNCPHVRRSKGDEYITNIHMDTDYSDEGENNSGYHVVDVVAMTRDDDDVVSSREHISNKNSSHDCVKNVSLDTSTVENLVRTLAEMEIESNESDTTNDFDSESDFDSVTLEDIYKLEEENRRLKEPVTCKICFDAIACIVTLPCGHMVSCFQCIPALTTCAVCRTPIKGTVRALMAVNYSNDRSSSS